MSLYLYIVLIFFFNIDHVGSQVEQE